MEAKRKLKRILKQPRVWILAFFLLFSILTIPSFKPTGIEAAYVNPESIFAGQVNEGDLITSLNNVDVVTVNDYQKALKTLEFDKVISITAGGQAYRAIIQTINITNETNETEPQELDIDINVRETKKYKLSLGLDLQGGARVVLEPIPTEGVLDEEMIDTTIEVLVARLNAYGLKNMIVRKIRDVEGHYYIEVEMAGEGSEKVVDLVKSVGKFELKVLDEVILTGDAIVPPIGEPQQDTQTGGWQVPFAIKPAAAADLRDFYVENAPDPPDVCSTSDDCNESFACSLGFAGSGGMCLPRIEMFLDEKAGFSAPPAQSLYQTWKFGEASTDLVIQSPDLEQATSVKIVLEAGRLPSKIKELRVISQDYVDPKLGKDFLRGAAFAGLGALVAVAIVVSLRYRKLKIVVPMLFTGISEVIIILGFASLIKWSIDLPAIAGIITAVGTGMDQQIIITDEILRGERSKGWSVRKNVKTAFAIIVAAAMTTIAAMLPLAYPGFTGLYALRGFAIVTIIGVLSGILITRPTYAKVAEVLLEEEN